MGNYPFWLIVASPPWNSLNRILSLSIFSSTVLVKSCKVKLSAQLNPKL
jgi:hypothetical protein